MSNIEQSIWSEKYRPTKIADCILPEATKNMVIEAISSGNVPHFLFDGGPGTGKTTLARAIASELDADLLFVNASLESNIDTLRTKITQFVTTVSFTESRKVVLLDEADYLNANSTMPALRSFIDQFSKNCIFILTCNYKSRIIDPLLSRLTVVDFKFTKEEKSAAAMQMHKRACQILDIEQIEYEKKAVAAVVSKNFPDFRKTLVQLQRFSMSGKIDAGIVVSTESSSIDEYFEHVKNKDFTKCRQWIANNSPDAASFYRGVYDKALTVLVPQTIPQMILFIDQYQFQAVTAIDLEINMMAFTMNFMANAAFK